MNRKVFLKVALTGLAAALSASAGAEKHETLRIGLTAVILNNQTAFLARWSDYLAKRIGSPVSFVAREAYQEILDLLFAGELDAAWICGYPYIRHQHQMQLLAVPLYEGRPLYQAYLIRPKQLEAVIRGWADLKGKVLAYSDPLSNSGWLVAQIQLHAAGLKPRDLKKTFFAHGHRNVAEAVAARLAQAGSIDGYVWETMRRQGMSAVDQTEIVWKSEFFGFPPLVTRANTKHPKTQALQDTLLAMGQEPEGSNILESLNLTGFEAGSPSLFASIERMASDAQTRTT